LLPRLRIPHEHPGTDLDSFSVGFEGNKRKERNMPTKQASNGSDVESIKEISRIKNKIPIAQYFPSYQTVKKV
jgi:hypothetical protein